jgi:hypothetical protein
MALASWPARQGQQRSLRRILQVLSWAFARSPGARSCACARVASFCDCGLFLSCTEPGRGPDTGRMSPSGPAITQVHAVPLVLAGVERPVRGDPVDRDQGPVHHDVGVPGLLRVPHRPAQLRPRAASRSTVSRTYRQAVVAPAPNRVCDDNGSAAR